VCDRIKMDLPNHRLRKARIAAGFKSGADSADFLGMKRPTYTHYESGERSFAKIAPEIARRLKVNLEWLLTGRGDMKNGSTPNNTILIMGIVTAGAHVVPPQEDWDAQSSLDLPQAEDCGALIVQGTSQWPRYWDGEIILYDLTPQNPEDLLDQYAVCVTDDGHRTLLKIIRKGNGLSFRLESHNAPPEDDVLLRCAHKVIGTLCGNPVNIPPLVKKAKPQNFLTALSKK
jgi:transcriptional regulator with XRE-family HTH domain